MTRLMLLALILPLALHPVYLYATAPIACLRTACTYIPPGASSTRQAGLDVAPPIPAKLADAIRVQEDSSFYTHPGVSLGKIVRIIGKRMEYDGRLGGVSTLEMQIAKNVFTGGGRSLWRKYKQMVYALRIDREFTKPEIMRIYAALAQVGPGMYGVQTGARAYFGKEVDELSTAGTVAILALFPDPVENARSFDGPMSPRVRSALVVSVIRAGETPEEAISQVDRMARELSGQMAADKAQEINN